jgi:AcrR family transcriptional regulator
VRKYFESWELVVMRGDESALIAGAVAGWSYAEVAAAAGVSVSTVQRRLRDPQIMAAVQEERTQQRRQTVGRLNDQLPVAIERLGELLEDSDPKIALRAIGIVLGSVHRIATTLEFDERLALLEVDPNNGESL